MISMEKIEFKNYLISHNYKRYINIYTISLIIISIILLLFSITYKYDIKEEFLSKNNNFYLSFEIENNKITKLDKYKLVINNEEINYKITNIEQGINKSKITILPEKYKCDSTYCKISLIRNHMTLKKEITEKIKEMM